MFIISYVDFVREPHTNINIPISVFFIYKKYNTTYYMTYYDNFLKIDKIKSQIRYNYREYEAHPYASQRI